MCGRLSYVRQSDAQQKQAGAACTMTLMNNPHAVSLNGTSRALDVHHSSNKATCSKKCHLTGQTRPTAAIYAPLMYTTPDMLLVPGATRTLRDSLAACRQQQQHHHHRAQKQMKDGRRQRQQQ
jgi:hypothetical protein